MIRPYLPLNGLRAFEAAARHASFTKAAIELNVTPAALGHQVKALEERLGTPLFHRLPRGLALTDEGQALLPVLKEAFDRMAAALARFDDGRGRALLSVGAVGSFAIAWLLPRLPRFEAAHPEVDLRLSTNNNRVDIAEEGLDFAIRFGDGAWHGTDAALAVPDAADRPVRRGDRRQAEAAGGPARRNPAALLSQRRMAALVRGGRDGAAAADRPGVRFSAPSWSKRRSPGMASRWRRCACSGTAPRGPSRPRSISAATG